jgi:TIR domain
MALELFYSYSHEDEKLRDKLEKQLCLLRRTGLIVNWHDRRIGAGQEWREQIDAHVRSAHIILLLISTDFINSDYCYGVEMQIALERQAKHEVVVIPVILRPVDWSTAPFANLQVLPRNGKPITKWADEDEAFADVARSIREVVVRFEPSAPAARPDPGLLVDRLVPEPRVVDAAIPSHVVKDLATELLIQIRLPNSPGLRGILQGEEEFEAQPEDVRSRPFNVVFPLGPTGRPEPLKITVKVTSPDFSPHTQAKNIFVPPEKDSDVYPFVLTPRRVGRLRVLVELEWEDAVRGHRSLLTSCVAEATEAPVQREMNLVQMRMTVGTGAAEASSVGTDPLSRAGSSEVMPLPAPPAASGPPAPAPSSESTANYEARPAANVLKPPYLTPPTSISRDSYEEIAGCFDHKIRVIPDSEVEQYGLSGVDPTAASDLLTWCVNVGPHLLRQICEWSLVTYTGKKFVDGFATEAGKDCWTSIKKLCALIGKKAATNVPENRKLVIAATGKDTRPDVYIDVGFDIWVPEDPSNLPQILQAAETMILPWCGCMSRKRSDLRLSVGVDLPDFSWFVWCLRGGPFYLVYPDTKEWLMVDGAKVDSMKSIEPEAAVCFNSLGLKMRAD